MLLLSAFIIGFLGSLHCVGMCGPVYLAFYNKQDTAATQWRWTAWYHLGRISTYGLLGGIVGLTGLGLNTMGLQGWFSIFLGILFLVAALFAIDLESRIQRWKPMQRLYHWVSNQMSLLLSTTQKGHPVMLGMLNGLLPCGLVYLALGSALAFSQWYHSLLYLLFFGLGTLPLLLLTAYLGGRKSIIQRIPLKRWTPYLLGTVALILIYRGLSVEMPLTLKLWGGALPMCH